MTCIGIVGGLGVGATVHYYEKITAACKARGVVPDLMFNHADVERGQGFVREGKLDEMGAYLSGFVDRLAAGGADVVAIPAVTPHIAIKQIQAHTKVPLINIIDAIGTELRARRLRKVALFGTIFTMQGSLWGQMTESEIVKPQPDEMDFVGKAYQRILDTQAADPTDAARLREIAATLQKRDGVEMVLLAGTDLALMFDETSAGFPCIDVARLHIDAIVTRLLS